MKVTDIVTMKKHHQLEEDGIAAHFEIELFMVKDALNFYTAHSDYINTDIEIDELNDEQLAEAQYGTRPDSLLSRRKPVS